MRTLFLAASFLSCSAGYAQEIFGLRIGQPLTLNECARLAMPKVDGFVAPYATVTSACLKNLRPVSAGVVYGLVAFPPGQGARHSISGDVLFAARNGALELIEFTTAGAAVQHAVMADLRDKFGPPTSQSTVPTTSMSGASFESITASWRQQALQVEFRGTSGRVDAGTVTVGTPAAVERHMSRHTTATSTRPM